MITGRLIISIHYKKWKQNIFFQSDGHNSKLWLCLFSNFMKYWVWTFSYKTQYHFPVLDNEMVCITPADQYHMGQCPWYRAKIGRNMQCSALCITQGWSGDTHYPVQSQKTEQCSLFGGKASPLLIYWFLWCIFWIIYYFCFFFLFFSHSMVSGW